MNKEAFRILHFNDVYDIQASESQPVGGVARFKTALDSAKNDTTLVLFSGDVFSPSKLSNIHFGKQMIKPINSFGIHAACFGNHDFDFPMSQVMQLKQQTNFPWVLSNILDKSTGRRLGEAEEYVILKCAAYKIGIFALAQKEWVDVMTESNAQLFEYLQFIDYAEMMVKCLKEEHNCDLVIALTHMMGHNDNKLAQKVKGIDLILGGHDHAITNEQVNGTRIIKSGTNFKLFSIVKFLEKQNHKEFEIERELIQVDSSYPPNPQLEAYVNSVYQQFEQKNNQIYCYTQMEFDLRFEVIRKQESLFLNAVADWYRFATKSDVAILNAGNFRADCIIRKGPITYGTVSHQIEDIVVTKKVKGQHIYKCLQNSVCMYPNLAGRFASVSGIKFTWDSRKDPFHRVDRQSIMVNNQPIDFSREYVLCTHDFHANGGDGFTCLKECEYLITKKANIINWQLVSDILDPTKKAIQYMKQHPNQFHLLEVQNKKYISIRPDQNPRTFMLK